MPSRRHHTKGQLVINFNVEFPETLSEEAMKNLEVALPPRPTLPAPPKNHVVDEVVLDDVDPMRAQRAQNGDEMDEDEDGPQGHGVSCQNQ
jgi:DnaJ-class molecular chaperone